MTVRELYPETRFTLSELCVGDHVAVQVVDYAHLKASHAHELA